MTLVANDDNLVLGPTLKEIGIDEFFGEARPEDDPGEWRAFEAGYYRLDENTLAPIVGGWIKLEDRGWTWLPTVFGSDEVTFLDARFGAGLYREIGVIRDFDEVISLNAQLSTGLYRRLKYIQTVEEFLAFDAVMGAGVYSRLKHIEDFDEVLSANARFGTGLYNLVRHIEEFNESISLGARMGAGSADPLEALTVSIDNQSGSCVAYGFCTSCKTWTDSHVIASGGIGNLTYLWSVDGGPAVISNPNIRNPEICHENQQTFQGSGNTVQSTIRLTVTDEWGVEETDSAIFTTTHREPVPVTISADDISSSCGGLSDCTACANASLTYSGGESDGYEFFYEYVSGASVNSPSLPLGWTTNDSIEFCRNGGVAPAPGNEATGTFKVTVRDPSNHQNTASDTFTFTTTHLQVD